MSKRFSSTQGWLGFALDLARKSKFEEAQHVLAKLTGRQLSSSDLRLAAQVNRRCERLDRAEACWLKIEQCGQMEPGDYYMLGSLQMQMANPESAAQCFEREISIAARTGTNYYLGSASIRLADLMVRLDRPARAKEVLATLEDGAFDYVDGVGLRTKAAILQEIESKTGDRD
ncbi:MULTISPECIES: hypothetical protein [unclassified Variovorax]|uniref:hypothetical protein n=1 Tax=unclassified Variovorax TaxID=663243 RepID=UPI003ECCE8F0